MHRELHMRRGPLKGDVLTLAGVGIQVFFVAELLGKEGDS